MQGKNSDAYIIAFCGKGGKSGHDRETGQLNMIDLKQRN
jgi:hypothetical protein